MSANLQLELNGKCILADINHFQFNKIPFHWNGFRRAVRQVWRECWRIK